MKKRGFTLIEILIVIALIGILAGIGGVSIKKQAESKAMLRVQNEIGDFFRVAAKRSLETGKKYDVKFKLDQKIIELSRNGQVTDILDLPNTFEYGIKWGSYKQTFNSTMKSQGYLSLNFTMYIFKSNSSIDIQATQEVKYAISFDKDDHIKYLYVREYIPIGIVTSQNIITQDKSPSENTENLKLIRD